LSDNIKPIIRGSCCIIMKLTKDHYLNPDIVHVAKKLLGKKLSTNFDENVCSGIIVETEAYAGITDRASHAFGGRNTQRTSTLYREGGIAYVYMCYGIHHLFNVVTNIAGIPHAVLVRAIEPVKGIPVMLERRQKTRADYTLCAGPGSVSQALGIHTRHNGTDLQGNSIWIEDTGIIVPDQEIIASPRVGVAYAREDALLPYRFRIKGNKWVSRAQ
jgi:DNA-3-methyladenine glycosylase